MKFTTYCTTNFYKKLYKYYLYIFLEENIIRSKFNASVQSLLYPILYKETHMFYIYGWCKKTTKRNGFLNQTITMYCNVSKCYFLLNIPIQNSSFIIY